MVLGRVVKPREALWLPEDLAWAKALLALEADTCPGCGHPRSETTGPEDSTTYKATVTRCLACAAADREIRSYTSDAPDSAAGDTSGLLVSTHRVT